MPGKPTSHYEVFRREHLAFISTDYAIALNFAELLSLWHKDWTCPAAALTRIEQDGKVLVQFDKGKEVKP